MLFLTLFQPLGVIPVLINPIAVLLAVLPGMFMALISLFKPKSLKAGAIMIWRLKFPLAGIALAIYGLRLGLAAVLPDRGPATAAVELSEQDWPHFRGDAERRGWVRDGAADPVTGGVNWSFREGNSQWFIASPAVVGNRVYIPSVTVGAFGGLNGAIYCLDADTGALVWKGGPSDYRGSFSSAVVKGDRLVVGEGLHITNDARAICMDISDESNPRVLWTFRTRSHIEGTPTIDQGRVFFTAGGDGIYGLDLESGEKIWHLVGAEYNDPETSILAHDGKVYIGLGFGRHGQAIVQVDGATGEVLHRIETPYPVFGPPSIHGDLIFFGMGNGDFVFSAEDRVDYVLDILRSQGVGEEELAARRATLGPGGSVWALNRHTMELVWDFAVDRSILSSVTVTPEGLYFASRTGGIYHLDFDGNRLAYWNSGEPVLSSLSVTEEHVYVVTSGGMLYVLRSDDLSPVWDLRLGRGSMFFSSPAVTRGQIIVGTETAGVVSVGEPDEAGRAVVWSGDGGGAGRAGRADDAPLPFAGAFEVNLPETAQGTDSAAHVRLTPLVADNFLITAFDLPTPHLHAQHEQGQWTRELSAPATAVVRHNELLAVSVGGSSPGIQIFRLEDGTPVATLEVDHDLPLLLQANEEGFWFRETAFGFALLDGTGAVRARAASSLPPGESVITPSILFTVSEKKTLAAMDRPSGKVLWQTELPAPATGGLFPDGTRLLLPSAAGLLSFDSVSGQPSADWAAPSDPMGDTLAVDRTEIVLITDSGGLLRLDRRSGAERFRTGGAVPGRRPLLERSRVFWLGETGIHSLSRDETDPQPFLWADSSWLGAPDTGLLAHRSKLHVGLRGWGLVTFGEAQ